MAEKFKNTYRVPSARLQNWDYGTNGAYFITICTKEMKRFFGEVRNKEMILNTVGTLAEKYWLEIAEQFPYIELGNFQIMPNHMHGILIIDKPVVQTRLIASPQNKEMQFITSNPNIETRLIASVQMGNGGCTSKNNPMLAENISRIIRWYKGRCTFEIRKINPNFEWHARFYDHIIRSSESFEKIQNYIEENPIKWEEDKFYKN